MLVCRLEEPVFCHSWDTIAYRSTPVARPLDIASAGPVRFAIWQGLHGSWGQVSRCVHPHKYLIRELPPGIILNETFAYYNITRRTSSVGWFQKGALHKCRLPEQVEPPESWHCGSNLSHVRHMHQNNIMVSDHTV